MSIQKKDLKAKKSKKEVKNVSIKLIKKGGAYMVDKSKEKVFAERQDNYKQEKETIFKKALAEHEKQSSKETKDEE